MQLKDEILKEHSKGQCHKIVQWVGKSQQRFDELFVLFLQGEYRITQRASWPLSYCVEAHPAFMKNNFESLLNNLQQPGLHDAVKRNTMRLLQYVDIPEKFQGKVMDICFAYVAAPTEAVAIKAFSLTVLGNLAKIYPEILPEIKLLVQEQLPYQTAAFKSRAKHFLQ
jgi:hypothetical protein